MEQLNLLPDTVMIEREGKFLFLVPSKPDWIVTNSNGAYILSLCNGNRSLEMIGGMAEERGLKAAEASKFLKQLNESNFFEPKRSFQLKVTNGKPSLQSVHLNMHKDCNLECIYCYAEERVKEGNPLTKHEYFHLIDELTSIAPNLSIEFTGGEPLLNKHTVEIAEYAKSKGHITRLLTNATPINPKNAERISKAFDQVRISIDGNEQVNDYLRGEGTHQQISEAIRLLDCHNANLQIAMTVTQKNIGQIGYMTEQFGGRLTFQPLFNAGTAKLNQELAITGDDYYKNLSSTPNVNTMAGVSASILKLRNRGTTKCAIGDVEISISHDGVVYPCHMVHSDEFAAGNIREQPIGDIYQNSPVLNKSRSLTIDARPECSECEVRLFCGGSCRARALYLAGDINACDEFCDYEYSAYLDALFASTEQTSC